MDGVTSWDLPRDPTPSELLLIGEAAFPVMVNDKGQVLIAASSYGQGRLVVVSHEGYLMHAGLTPFLLNAVSWLCPCPGAPVGVHPSLTPLGNILEDAGLEAQIKPRPGKTLGVYCISAYNDAMTATLIQFVKHGGGLLIGGQAWYWASKHGSDKVLSKFPGNKVTSVAGVYFTDNCGDRARFKVSKKVPKIPLHVRNQDSATKKKGHTDTSEQLAVTWTLSPKLWTSLNSFPSERFEETLILPTREYGVGGCIRDFQPWPTTEPEMTDSLRVSEEKRNKPSEDIFDYDQCGEDVRQDQQQLLEGISELDIRAGGVPSALLVHGALAFPLGLDASLNCFLAAARYGRGRVVLAAHECLLCAPKMGPFLLNAVRWLAGGQTGKVGVNTSLKDLCSLLSERGLECNLEPHLNSNLGVYCCKAYSDKEAKQMQEFVAEGGGLLIGGQSRWWASQNPGHSPLAGFPGNIILNCFGLSILPQTLSSGCFPVPTPEMRSYHFRKALSEFQAILNHGIGNLEKSCLAKLRVDGAAFLQIPAEGVPAYISLHRLLRKMLRGSALPAVSWENPVAGDSIEAAVLSLATPLAHSLTDCSQLAKELGIRICSSNLYPSKHPITVEIEGNNPGNNDCWVSTGLYLLEGQNAEVSLSEAAASAGLKIQIGCHTDDLTKARKLCRAPVVTHQCCMDRTKQSVSCLWGGLLYIIVPKGRQLGPVSVTITGAVHAPYYKLGKTSIEEWKRQMQENLAPWGELATNNIILTVPTTKLQALENPEPVLRLWDEIMQAVARLAAQPFPFRRPERIVADVQISAGWMHSGYPIMCHLESVQELISETSMRSRGLWGPIHELGHNQQQDGWEFCPHTTEATCNLWSVYVHETVLGIPRAKAHEALSPPERERRIKDHLGKGAPLCDWNVWTALETYLQVLSRNSGGRG
ncbi:TRPM8 channel-associated factor 2 [Saguinus oedipus]|uniref:TRPM8 channel-associated factor 2 n=1 Tax=Saguinus oedipus TaxID=9490 RepID=A0ABQ9UIB5_SAGOE|nr:TRPM8 channel-associated factor 2 [Saguinus oedipus]